MGSRHQRTPSFSFRLRLPKAIQELDRATEEVLEGSWAHADRERVSEIASTLSEACRLEGLREAATMARSIACLIRVSPEQIRPVEAAFREKILELMIFLKDISDELLTNGARAGGS